jgi:signal peptidase I
MWLIEKYLWWGVLFLALWGMLYVWSSFSCQTVNTAQMEPYLVKEGFIIVRAKKIAPEDMEAQQDVIQFESSVAKERFSRYVGRVIGKPGDRIRIDKGKVFRAENGKNFQEIVEQYVRPELMSPPSETMEDIIIPRDCYWLMGDNRKREADKDSRRFGPIPMHAVDGAAGKMPLSK